jgi:hypothetical protein
MIGHVANRQQQEADPLRKFEMKFEGAAVSLPEVVRYSPKNQISVGDGVKISRHLFSCPREQESRATASRSAEKGKGLTSNFR